MEDPIDKDTASAYHEQKAAEVHVGVAEAGRPAANPFAIPGAIVLAGIIVAGAVMYTGHTNAGLASEGLANVQPPPPPVERSVEKVAPVTADDFILGSPVAPVKIIEYADLECPWCKRFHSTIKEMMMEYGGDGRVAWVFRHFPLDSLHKKARTEAIAAECVGKIGGNDVFWKYVDRIFESTASNDGLDINLLDTFASELNIDKTAFAACRASNEAADAVNSEFEDAIASGGTGTPFSVIITANGQAYPFSGAQPIENLRQAIDQALEQK